MNEEYDEGSDIDNWENEAVFQDHEGDELNDEAEYAECVFNDAYENLFGVRPAFSVEYLGITQIRARTANLLAAHAARQFVFA